MKLKNCLLAFVALCAMSLTACAPTQVPTSYNDPTTGLPVSYTPAEENILKACANIEANLPLIRSGASLSVGGILQASIKTPTTLQNDGALCWQISHAVYSATSTTQTKLPTSTDLTGIVKGFTSNQTDAEVVKDVGLLTSALNNVYSSYYAQLQALAAQTTNKTVQAQIVKTGLDVLNALAGGVMDGTEQYAPTTSTPTAWIRWSDLRHLV